MGLMGPDPLQEAQNIDFLKPSEWGLPGVENVPTSLETIFKLSRASQRPYIKTSQYFENSLLGSLKQ